ncbi:MAG: 2-polyprenylphenol 6-hydroxylase [Planktomarina sp.]
MRGPHNIFRLIRTGATLERTGAMSVILEAMEAPRSVRIVARVLGWPFQWLGYKGDPSLPPATRALQAMGPGHIKLGQVLSTRPDVVGPELAKQLRILQDSLPPFPMDAAKARVERELGQKLEDIYSDFSQPVAAASIAQVHKATLRSTGKTVAVKILRPGIEKSFMHEIDAFYLAAWIVNAAVPSAKRMKPLDVIDHFKSVVDGELDLRLETAAASEFLFNTQNDAGFRLPNVKWQYSSRHVMTQTWADGFAASDLDAIQAAGLDTESIGTRILQLFLTHALRDGYFHGDMHQGNIKIAPNGDVIAYDFGIMGRIDEYTRRVYAEILYGFIKRDYQRVAEVHFEAGYVPASKDVDAFARALRSVGEPIFGMDATQISMGRLLKDLFEVTETFGMETRTELILLQRTMVVVEGVARSFNPHINMWDVAKPILETYIKDSIGPKALARDLAKTVKVLARFGPLLPQMAEDFLIRTHNPPVEEKPKKRTDIKVALGVMAGFAAGVAAMMLY